MANAYDSAEKVILGPFVKGVRYDKGWSEVDNDELASMQNVRIDQSNRTRKRGGSASYQSASAVAGTPTMTSIFQFEDSSGDEHVISTATTKLYEYDSGWSDITGSLSLTLGSDYVFEWVSANGTAYGVNRNDQGVKWTGSGNGAHFTMPTSVTKANHIAFFDNRLWIANTNLNSGRLHRSEAGAYETWEGSYDFGGPILGIQALGDALVVHTDYEINLLISTGVANTPYRVKPLNVRGGRAGRGLVAAPDKTQFYVRPDGVYRLKGEETRKISHALDEGFWADVTQSRLWFICMEYYGLQNELWVFLPYETNTKLNRVVIYRPSSSGGNDNGDDEGIWYGPYDAWELNSTGMVDEKPHAGDYDGIVLDLDTGLNDSGSAIVGSYRTGYAEAMEDDSITRSRWLFARHFFDNKGDYTASVQQIASDIVGEDESVTMGFSGGAFPFALDSDLLADGTTSRPESLSEDTRLRGYGSATGLSISNSGVDETFAFHHHGLVFKELGKKRKRKSGVN